jgi:hypothetical protein
VQTQVAAESAFWDNDKDLGEYHVVSSFTQLLTVIVLYTNFRLMVTLGVLTCYFCITEFKYWSYYWRTAGVVNLIFKSSNYGSGDLNILVECWYFYFVKREKNSWNLYINSATLLCAFVLSID